MRIDIRFAWNENVDSDLTEEIKDILRMSYDYQNDQMDFLETDDDSGNKTRSFVIYPELCDQRKRTEETLEKILDLIKETI